MTELHRRGRRPTRRAWRRGRARRRRAARRARSAIIAGFEEIQRFVEKHGRAPQHGEDRDIFERLYAVRLDRLRALDECRALLAPLDHQGLAGRGRDRLPIGRRRNRRRRTAGRAGRGRAERRRHHRAAACPLRRREARRRGDRQSREVRGLRAVQAAVRRRCRKSWTPACARPAVSSARPRSRQGASSSSAARRPMSPTMDEPFTNEHGERDARLRVIFDNGTESNLLLRSFQRALQQGRRRPAHHRACRRAACSPTRARKAIEPSGTIYVLRSKSDHPVVAANRDVLHKIGVTGGEVDTRIANARLDPTFLMADVEIVATYELYNINRSRARKPDPPHLRAGAARHRDQGPLRQSGRPARMVPRAAVRDRRGGGKNQGRDDYRLLL